jgi:hypothetical protein
MHNEQQNEQQIKPAKSQDSVTVNARKSWVTPVVSKSPINEITAAGNNGIGEDGGFYS